MYHGDIRLGDTIDIKFCTVQGTGGPTTLAGSPVISAYPGNSTTQLTTGITLSVDFDSVTGFHNVRVVASGGNGYLTATNYALVITTGTVNSVSAVGYVIGTFSIENRSALMPTTAALTLDVSATGEAGVDWANVGGKTTVNALTNTSIITTQKVDVDTIKTNPVVNGGTITFPTTATLASTTNLTAGTIATVSGNVNGSVGSVTGAVGSVTGAVGSVTGAVGSVTGNVGGNVVGSVASVTARVTANTDQLAGQTVTAAAGVTFPTSVASPTNLTAGTLTTVTTATNLTTNNDKTGYTLSNTGMDNILDRAAGVETNFTLRQALRLMLSSAVAKLSGAATTTIAIRDINDTKDRITATVDASGNRSAVTTDVS